MSSERTGASIQATAKSVILQVKWHFDDANARYQGPAKNTQRIYLLVEFANLMMARFGSVNV